MIFEGVHHLYTGRGAVSEQQPDPDDGGAESFADAAIDSTPTVFAAVPQEHSEIPTSVGKKPGRRVGWTLALGLGYVVLAAGTAFGVIVDKSPEAVDVTAVNASAYAAPVPVPSASVAASASAAPSPSTAPTTATVAPPTPKSTVTGSVSGGIHSGDLRYFLLPPQGTSSVQGNADGNTDTLDEAVTAYGGSSGQRSILEQAGFKTAADRTYQDTTMSANVRILLIQFDSSSESQQWLDGISLSGSGYASIPVPGVSGALGWSYAKDNYYELVGLYREGDTYFEVHLYGQQLIPASDLGQVVSAEHSRLANG
jgi:hypothetical protein